MKINSGTVGPPLVEEYSQAFEKVIENADELEQVKVPPWNGGVATSQPLAKKSEKPNWKRPQDTSRKRQFWTGAAC